jgi:hypothetical protein
MADGETAKTQTLEYNVVSLARLTTQAHILAGVAALAQRLRGVALLGDARGTLMKEVSSQIAAQSGELAERAIRLVSDANVWPEDVEELFRNQVEPLDADEVLGTRQELLELLAKTESHLKPQLEAGKL